MQIISVCTSGNAEFAGVDNAGVDNSARCGRGGKCRSGEMRVKMCIIVMTGKESMAY